MITVHVSHPLFGAFTWTTVTRDTRAAVTETTVQAIARYGDRDMDLWTVTRVV